LIYEPEAEEGQVHVQGRRTTLEKKKSSSPKFQRLVFGEQIRFVSKWLNSTALQGIPEPIVNRHKGLWLFLLTRTTSTVVTRQVELCRTATGCAATGTRRTAATTGKMRTLVSKSTYKVSRSMQGGHRRATIIPVDTILRSVHLIPRFRHVSPSKWTGFTALEQCNTFYINPFTDQNNYLTFG
jgi:hypothetical protein